MLAVSVGAGFLANFWVKTEEELIDDYLKAVEGALEFGDLERCMILVHPRYNFEGVSAWELRRMCVALLMRAPARDVIVAKRSVRIAGPKATVHLSVAYLPKPEAKLAYGVKSTWIVHLLKVKKYRPVGKPCWLATGLRPITVGEEHVGHLRNLRYHLVVR